MKTIYYPLIGVSLLLCRILYIGASLGDALALIALSSAFCFVYHTESKKEPEVNLVIHKKVENLENGLLEVKSNLASVRAAQTLKPGFR